MGAHTYSLEQFGIDPVLIKRLFADYLQQHPRLARAGDVPSGRSRAHPAP
jgi:hypothetical protein